LKNAVIALLLLLGASFLGNFVDTAANEEDPGPMGEPKEVILTANEEDPGPMGEPKEVILAANEEDPGPMGESKEVF